MSDEDALELAKNLIDHGATIQIENQWEKTPLLGARQQGKTKTAAFLSSQAGETSPNQVTEASKNKSNPSIQKHSFTPISRPSSSLGRLSVKIAAFYISTFQSRPLMYCIKRGFHDVALHFIDQGIGMQEKKDGNTALSYACYYPDSDEKSLELARLLIEQGADFNTLNHWGYGYTPLSLACKKGKAETIKFLIESGADLKRLNLEGKIPYLSFVIENVKGDKKALELANLLIEKGAHINTKTNPPLIAACLYGKEEIIKLLIENGADVNLQDSFKRTPLCIILERAKDDEAALELVKLLIEKKVNCNTPDDRKQSPFLWACSKKLKQTSKFLIENGLDVNQVDRYGETPLFYVVRNMSDEDALELAKSLAKHGANIHIKNKEGSSPLIVAEKTNKTKTAIFLSSQIT
jgi:ankyrin repeat protein